ncbi:DUF6053 domain-containing protein [Lysobacter enzymogenes]|uniref:DUF6053 domain-containing protein n=1 Tax=Lysobacter enzymogenes TaxID=69 RepID=UPI003D18A384
MGGPSGPMLLCQIAAIRPNSIGPEGPPTKAAARSDKPAAAATCDPPGSSPAAAPPPSY